MVKFHSTGRVTRDGCTSVQQSRLISRWPVWTLRWMGEVCHAPELKVEVTCRTDRVEETVAAVKRAHPYEEPVINVIPLYRTGL